jgi:hypothetical protein
MDVVPEPQRAAQDDPLMAEGNVEFRQVDGGAERAGRLGGEPRRGRAT